MRPSIALAGITFAWAVAAPPAYAEAGGAAICNAGALKAAAPNGLTLGPIANLNPLLPAAPDGVRWIAPEAGRHPGYCLVTGRVVTNPRTGKTANFGLVLPPSWNGKFLFMGCSGMCGAVFTQLPVPSKDSLPVGGDPVDAVTRGYAIAATDDGHQTAEFDGRWALKRKGVPASEAVADYWHRAVHAVTLASRRLVENLYSRTVSRSYFFGCSEGGREAMVEASTYPDDFDGLISGNGFIDPRDEIVTSARASRALLPVGAFLPAPLARVVQDRMYAECDGKDGVKDGLIQNPAICGFEPQTMLCKPGTVKGECLTAPQVSTLRRWMRATRDRSGRVIGFGYATGDLVSTGYNLYSFTSDQGPPASPGAAEPWGNYDGGKQPAAWQVHAGFLKYLVYLDGSFDANRRSPVGAGFGIGDPDADLIRRRTMAGNGSNPARLDRFVARGGKLIMFDGYGDGWINPYRKIAFYKEWAGRRGGYATLQRNARMFAVPSMLHCGNGTGPNRFDALTALEKWVEQDAVPDALIAVKHQDDDPAKPPLRTMPVCAFPTRTSYDGRGDVLAAASWSCTPNTRLLDVGPNGRDAGLVP